MSISYEEIAGEHGQELAEAFTEALSDKADTDFSFENLASLGNNVIAAFVEGFHAVYIPWVARAIAEQRDDAIDRAVADTEAGDDQ